MLSLMPSILHNLRHHTLYVYLVCIILTYYVPDAGHGLRHNTSEALLQAMVSKQLILPFTLRLTLSVLGDAASKLALELHI